MVDEFPEMYTQQVDISSRVDTIQLEQCRLVVVDGPDAGKQLTLDKPIVRIGSNSKNDLVLSDNTVSRFHCEIRHVRDEYLFVDRQSTNGCYFGDLRLVEGYLYPNCEILVGNSLIRFEPLVERIEIVPSKETRYGDLIGSAPAMMENLWTARQGRAERTLGCRPRRDGHGEGTGCPCNSPILSA